LKICEFENVKNQCCFNNRIDALENVRISRTTLFCVGDYSRESKIFKFSNFQIVTMYAHTTQIRVRYGETDRMGYLYYGNYAQYYEVGRVEAMRNIGLSYKGLEDSGILMPVVELQSTFVKPAHYDDLLTVTTTITEMPKVKMYFEYEIVNEAGDTINYGKTTLFFLDAVRRKPCRAPAELTEKLAPFFI